MRYRWTAAAAALLAATAGTAPSARAQSAGDGFLFRRPTGSLALRVGYDQALARSDFFSDAASRLTLNRRDFGAPTVGADLAFSVRDRLDLTLGGAFSRARQASEYRDFVGVDDLPIAQRTTFTRAPVTAALRYYLAPRGERVGQFAWLPARGVAPFVAVGGGAVYYSLRQEGEVLNEATLIARPADLRSSGTVPLVLGAAGVDVSISPRFFVTTEARYTRARATLSSNFSGFEPLDLSGVALTGGIAVRF